MADPVTLAEATLHLRLPSTIDADEQAEITRMISAATEYCENYTNRKWTTGSRMEHFDSFNYSALRKNQGMYLPGGNISAITSITYFDSLFVQQTLDASKYRLVGAPNIAYVYPAMGEQWPTDVAHEPLHIEVTYQLDGSVSVPTSVKQAVLLVLGSLYEYREDGVVENAVSAVVKAPKAANDLLNPYRIRIA